MNHKGMSLIEIIVSMLVLTLLSMGVMSVYSFLGTGPKSKGYLATQATNYARETIEKLKNAVSMNATRNAPLVDSAGVPSSDSLPTGHPMGAAATRTYTVADVGPKDANGLPRYKKVTVSVTWPET